MSKRRPKTELVPAAAAPLEQSSARWQDVEEMVATMLADKAATTATTYAEDYRHFARWAGVSSPQEALGRLLEIGHGGANRLVLAYKGWLRSAKVSGKKRAGYATATINRRVHALRAFVATARLFGKIDWTLDVGGDARAPYRDTRGPGLEGIGLMLAELERRRHEKRTGVSPATARALADRDTAIIRLLYDNGLRRIEVQRLDYPEDLDLEGGRIQILGKQRTEQEWLSLAPKTVAALEAWLQQRGDASGPLFCGVSGSSKGARIGARALTKVISSLGKAVGLKVTPHGLRHTAITAALDTTGGNLRATARFSRHKDWRVLQHYDDNQEDHHGSIAKKISEDV